MTARRNHAKLLGVKGTYADMELPYHDRIQSATVDAMHTVKNVICNIMDIVLRKKGFTCRALELSAADLATADARFTEIIIPDWVDMAQQRNIVSRPKAMKSHDWKQVI